MYLLRPPDGRMKHVSGGSCASNPSISFSISFVLLPSASNAICGIWSSSPSASFRGGVAMCDISSVRQHCSSTRMVSSPLSSDAQNVRATPRPVLY